jgi:hypothetical protein
MFTEVDWSPDVGEALQTAAFLVADLLQEVHVEEAHVSRRWAWVTGKQKNHDTQSSTL